MAEAKAVASVLQIGVADLVHGDNARGELGDVSELANSLRALGQQQPLIVEPREDGRWTVFDGNRRLEAARAAGIAHLLAIPRTVPMTNVQRMLRQLGMHSTGKAFDPIAEAKAVEWLLFADDGPHMDRSEIARALSKSESWVKGRIDLLQLGPDEQTSVAKGTLPVSLALNTIAQRRHEASGRPFRVAAQPATVRCDNRDRCGCVCHKRDKTGR